MYILSNCQAQTLYKSVMKTASFRLWCSGMWHSEIGR